MKITSSDIINFWFSDSMQQSWFSSTPELDNSIRNDYETLWKTAASGDLDHWSNNAIGSLALVIILDQFPLNMYRNQAISFSTEQKAVSITCSAIERKQDLDLENDKLAFLYMPLMHSEDIEKQNLSVKLYKHHKLKNNIKFAEHHQSIIKQFGRFPHRNKILNRKNTQDEETYLNSDHAFLG